jgi:hypothetical protein
MAMSYTEPAIPPWGVAIEHDGCFRGWVDLPQAAGDVEHCAQFIANHLPPVGYEFNIYPIDGGHLRSFMIPAPTVARRVRLTIQDIKLGDC